MQTSKAGKHGHAKVVVVGVDIFTEKNYEDMCPTSHNMYVPYVIRKELALLDINSEGYLTLMEEDGSMKEDLNVLDPDVIKIISYSNPWKNSSKPHRKLWSQLSPLWDKRKLSHTETHEYFTSIILRWFN